MSLSVAQRSLALAAVALLAATLALVARSGDRSSTGPGSTTSPAASGWYEAVAGSRGAVAQGEPTACGRKLTAGLLGVSHSVLPCGAKLVVAYGGREVTTEVIDHRLVRRGVQFELTSALARRLGVTGTQRIRWRYAASG